MQRRARTFLARPRKLKALIAVAWILLGLSNLAIKVVTFNRLANRLGKHDGIFPTTPLATIQQEKQARVIGIAVKIAANYTPWASNCFPQAVTARILLGVAGIPYAIFFGVSRMSAETNLKAHAWVVSGRADVTGGKQSGDFTPVGCFISTSQ